MKITLDRKENTLIAGLEGRLDNRAAPDMREMIEDELQENDDLVLDLEKLEYISSAGLRNFLIFHKAMKDRGRKLTVVNVQDMVLEILDFTGFTGVLNIEN